MTAAYEFAMEMIWEIDAILKSIQEPPKEEI